MKKTATLLLGSALVITLISFQYARASEVSGTISTDGSTATTTDPSQTPNPSGGNNNGGDHSSEVGGQLGSGTSTTTDTTQNNQNTGGTTSSGNDNNVSGNVTGGSSNTIVLGGGVTTSGGGDTTQNSTNATTSSPTISDTEAAHLALAQFGPRYGLSDLTPGAPMSGGNYGSLSVGSKKTNSDYDPSLFPDKTSYESPFAYVPHSGEGAVVPQVAAAGTIQNPGGLSMTQLVLIAIVGLVLLGSTGYAISRSGNRAV